MKIKIYFLICLVFFLGAQIVAAQDELDTDKAVAIIRSDVLRTSKLLSTFKKTTKFVDDVSLEGTEATFYISTAGLKKIHAEMAGESYYAKADYYYSDRGELIFVYYVFNRYDTQIGMDPPPKVVNIEEKRLYFRGDKMIKRIITKTETSFPVDADDENELLELEKTFRKAMKN